MEGPFEVRNISVSIRRSPKEVYAFITSGESLPRWATGLGDKIQRVGGQWVEEGPLGKVKVRIAAPNELGVADQDVTLESGVTVHNPIRVVPTAVGAAPLDDPIQRAEGLNVRAADRVSLEVKLVAAAAL